MNAYKHILVPTDFTESCKRATERAREVAEFYKADITFLHIINYLPPGYVAVELPAEYASKEFLMDKAGKLLDEWADEHGLGNSKKIVETGQPKKVIVKTMQSTECDLVVLAPHAESGFAQFFGSVTNAVAQSTKGDVLIVRTEP